MVDSSRPGPIIGVCLVWAAFTGYAFFSFLNADLSAFPGWFSLYYMGITALAAVGVAGIWLMRKWGLVLYALSVIIDQGVLASQQHWHIFSLLLPMMVIMVSIAHLQDMK